MSEPVSFTQHVADYFKARPMEWISAVALESVGGRQGWRTRVSDCRLELGMAIENRVTRLTDSEGKPWTLSEYRYVPDPPADVQRGHDTNAFELRP